ncbi:hydrolethalus syndrome protein 1 [Trachemys scripta elegans]|uniref:hydrolethalus syndrome protein 1 n=1 Tax=Trachemys scripta elegans TaxID=31138 RepID=UPI001553B12B|nr:hydrolethalus syndrome protein 1 [Trachemys scripta elegans]XP_034610569.1 hydrolethalus syndrome protein 1 [Trachemys scripta elegans]XP_034610570.1 hydrolethalus syndrome protein 1 [Trachemys scripta elegans]XP_034610571.1 hydrolethalus syndrome protein 1 [Trachemys scripta elegans]
MEALIGPDRYRWATMNHKERMAAAAAMAFTQLCAEQGDGDSLRGTYAPTQYDPYSKASVTSGIRPSLHLLMRHHQAEHSMQPETLSEGPRGPRKPVMKRKVLRRMPDGEVHVSDESVTSEPETSAESDPEISDLRLRLLHLHPHQEDTASEVESEPNHSSHGKFYLDLPRRSGSHGDPPFLPRDCHGQGSPVYEQDLIMAGQPKSFIPPRLEQQGRNRGKIDRVARYFEYKRDWESFRIPGEDHRKELRWGIREQMLYKPDLPTRSQHIYVPNNYLVPTEKKRSALRWGVRCDLASGLIPRKSSFSS